MIDNSLKFIEMWMKFSLWTEKSENEKTELNQKILEIVFEYGNAEYYMGDELYYNQKSAQDFDWISFNYQSKDGRIGGSAFTANEAWEKYKIRLINWECTPPLKNEFI